MKIEREWNVSKNLKIAVVDNYPEETFQRLVKNNLLNSYPALTWQSELGAIEKEKHEKLKGLVKNRFRLKLAALNEGEIVGFASGWQLETGSDYYMGISLVESEFRKQGLYSKMLEIVLSITKEEGFTTVRSRHINTNTPVLIAKLKQGFIINGFELDETMGALLKMVYYHNDTRRKAAHYRSGKIDETSTLELLKQSTLE